MWIRVPAAFPFHCVEIREEGKFSRLFIDMAVCHGLLLYYSIYYIRNRTD